MDARMRFAACCAAAFVSLCLAAQSVLAASYRTQNFIVSAATPQLAQEIGDAAEKFRRELAIEWLGQPLAPWRGPCPITAQVAPQLGAGGATSFYFDQGGPHGWTMSIQGSRERILDSVLPHEVTHTIFATHFGRPLPRWADEGACTTVEHTSEKQKQERLLIQFLTTNRGIAFNEMFRMKEYPPDVLPLYSQGFSLAKFFIAQGGKRKFIDYLGDGMNSNNWTAATKKHYGFASLSTLQVQWVEWVRRGGREDVLPTNGTFLAAAPAPSATVPSGETNTSPIRLVSDTRPERATIEKTTNARVSPLPPLSPLPRVGPTESRPGNPGGNLLAANSARSATSGTSGSWYARRSERRNSDELSSETHRGVERESRDVREQPTEPRTMARPQPLEQPREIILEWSRLPPGSPARPSGSSTLR